MIQAQSPFGEYTEQKSERAKAEQKTIQIVSEFCPKGPRGLCGEALALKNNGNNNCDVKLNSNVQKKHCTKKSQIYTDL